MNKIYDNQRTWFETNSPLSVNFRLKNLMTLKKTIKTYEKNLFRAIETDLGKVEYETYMTELALIYREIKVLTQLLRNNGLKRKVKNNYLIGKSSVIELQARGQVLIIAPFNYPIQLSLLPLVGSIAAGNVSILKLSEHVPNTNKVIKELLDSIFDSGYVSVVEGGKEVVSELLSLSHDLIFFTGSTQVGKIVMEAASKTLTPVVLELGGKSPAVVFDDYDLKKAAEKILWGKVINSGQTCIAPDYVMVPKSKKEEFVNYLKQEVSALVPTGSLQVINEEHASRLLSMIQSVGSSVVHGGGVTGKYVDVTLVDGENIDGEIFGPILPVISYENENEIIEYINRWNYPLTMYTFTDDRRRSQWLSEKVRSGSVMVNDVLMHIANDSIPFGGVRSSGIGAYHGIHSLKTFAYEKPIVEGWKFRNPLLIMPFKKKLQDIKILRKFF